MNTKRTDAPNTTRPLARRDFFKLGAAAGSALGAAFLAGSRTAFAQDAFVPGWEIPPRNPAGKPISIDIHTHWTPEGYTRALNQLGRAMGGTTDPLRTDLEQRIHWMDGHGIQMMLLSLSGGMPWQWVTAKQGAHIAQIVNDAGAAAHAMFPDRFLGAIEISVRDPKLCVEELNRVGRKPGLCAVHLPNSLEGQFDYPLDPAFAPVLAKCEELGLPLLFHPLDGEVNYYGGPQNRLGGALSDSVRYWNTLGFTFDSATTATKFITTGTLDKFPKLDVILPHAGGSFPYLAGRVDQGLARKKFALQHPFREYIRRFHYDTMTYDLETLRFMIDLVGSDRVMIGTDNGLAAKQNFEWPNAIVERLNLPAADEDLILRGNAKRLFKL